MTEKLEPADEKQCQVFITEAHSAFRLGPKPRPHRCPEEPVVIVTEKKPQDDGQTGSMSMCADCLTKFIEQQGGDLTGYSVQTI